MDCEAPSSTAGRDVEISLEDREGDAMLFESLPKDETGDAGADDEYVRLWAFFAVGK